MTSIYKFIYLLIKIYIKIFRGQKMNRSITIR